MPARFRSILILAVILAGAIVASGCTEIAVGDVGYEAGTISVPVVNDGSPSDVFVQLTVYRIEGFTQEEYLVIMREVSLGSGREVLAVQSELPPGTYKIYIYIIQDGTRKAAVIRDIRVQ
jgi:hypothetical protein